ncbi:MAG: hypothetical protein WB992_15615 [Bryobacteraceae bacterium]
MRALVRSSMLVGALAARIWSAAAPAPVRVTVLVSFEQPRSGASLENLQSQLHGILSGAGVQLDVRDRNEVRAGAEFGQLLVFYIKGYCSMESLPVGALSDERGPLAMAYSTDGKILSFAEVECDNVRLSLERVLGRQSTRAYQPVFDTALGMVMAHEIYHMLAKTSEHTRTGLTKPGLTARELLDKKLSMPDIAQLAIRQNLSGLRQR